MFLNAGMTYVDKRISSHKKIVKEERKKIKEDKYSEDDLKNLRDKYRTVLNLTSDWDERQTLRLKYAKHFEALIWVLVCGGYENMVGAKELRLGSPSYAIGHHIVTVKDHWNIDPELVVYWVNNLTHPFGDGVQTFREKALKDLFGISGPARGPNYRRHELELDQVKRHQDTDSAQVDLKQ